MESLATQILVVFIIRTQHTPFYTSKPSRKLMLVALVFVYLISAEFVKRFISRKL